jgi:hypothetical protein
MKGGIARAPASALIVAGRVGGMERTESTPPMCHAPARRDSGMAESPRTCFTSAMF